MIKKFVSKFYNKLVKKQNILATSETVEPIPQVTPITEQVKIETIYEFRCVSGDRAMVVNTTSVKRPVDRRILDQLIGKIVEVDKTDTNCPFNWVLKSPINISTVPRHISEKNGPNGPYFVGVVYSLPDRCLLPMKEEIQEQ